MALVEAIAGDNTAAVKALFEDTNVSEWRIDCMLQRTETKMKQS